jgi:hypothetical protein
MAVVGSHGLHAGAARIGRWTSTCRRTRAASIALSLSIVLVDTCANERRAHTHWHCRFRVWDLMSSRLGSNTPPMWMATGVCRERSN